MSALFKYNFVSPEPLYAVVKEEMKSYFDSGYVDDLMFPYYTAQSLDKLGKSSYSVIPYLFDVEENKSTLPDNFYAIREAWMCTPVYAGSLRSGAFYSQANSMETIQVSPVISYGQPCGSSDCVNASCNGAECMPLFIQAVYKTTHVKDYYYNKVYRLKPGNIYSVDPQCNLPCFWEGGKGVYEIRDNKLLTDFKEGKVYAYIYVKDYDAYGNRLVPDNYSIHEYIKNYIKYKILEAVMNMVTDESFKITVEKLSYYRTLYEESYANALRELRSETIYDKSRAIMRNRKRFLKYEL